MLVCKECGGLNVDIEAWVNINTLAYTEAMNDESLTYCNDCEDFIKVIEEEDFKKTKK